MEVSETSLPGVVLIQPRVFHDERGFFLETWNEAAFEQAGIPSHYVQDNLSSSQRGVLRGLHFQHPGAQGKLVSVLRGEVFDVAVDIRPDSATFRQWFGTILSETNYRRLYIPEGYAHGFVVLSHEALFAYKCTSPYARDYERSIRWDDPQLAIDWPIADPVLSPKDAAAPLLRDLPPAALPRRDDATEQTPAGSPKA